VLFIGTKFSILYTSMYSPAVAVGVHQQRVCGVVNLGANFYLHSLNQQQLAEVYCLEQLIAPDTRSNTRSFFRRKSIYQRFFLPPAGDRQKLPWERMRPPAGGGQNI
jgi:hypothetical protein